MAKGKNKPHKGLLKRMRITKSGKVKHKSANSKHLKSVKSPGRLRRLRKDRFVKSSQAKGLEQLLFRRLRGSDQPRSALKRNPSPAERKAAEAEAKKAKA
jgi:large subunit ribosomal protein L35